MWKRRHSRVSARAREGRLGAWRHLVVTVDDDARRVEALLVTGRIVGPCGHRLAPWGFARERTGRGEEERRRRVRPRRARRGVCVVTHVSLPVSMLVRRRDDAALLAAEVRGRRRVDSGVVHRGRGGCGSGSGAAGRGRVGGGRCGRGGVVRHWCRVASVGRAAGLVVSGAAMAVSGSGGGLLASSPPAKWINTGSPWRGIG